MALENQQAETEKRQLKRDALESQKAKRDSAGAPVRPQPREWPEHEPRGK